MPFTAVHPEAGLLDATLPGLGCNRPWSEFHRQVSPRPAIVCPECGWGVHAKLSPLRVRFFCHDPGRPDTCSLAHEAMDHHMLKLELAGAIRDVGWYAQLEVAGADRSWRADVMFAGRCAQDGLGGAAVRDHGGRDPGAHRAVRRGGHRGVLGLPGAGAAEPTSSSTAWAAGAPRGCPRPGAPRGRDLGRGPVHGPAGRRPGPVHRTSRTGRTGRAVVDRVARLRRPARPTPGRAPAGQLLVRMAGRGRVPAGLVAQPVPLQPQRAEVTHLVHVPPPRA